MTEVTRRPKKPIKPVAAGSWMVTFADMVTLLLTFLVMIVAITTQDPHTVLPLRDGVLLEQGETSVQLGDGVLLFADQGRLAPVIALAENLDRLPPEVMLDQQQIKDAIFQLDPAKTPEYEQLQQAADEGINVFRDNRGLVVSWDRSLIFPEGESRLTEGHLELLNGLALFLKSLSLPVSVESHTNPLSAAEGGTGAAAYGLSLARSKAVMEYLAGLGVAEERFRLGGYGGSRPRGLDPDQAWENSRLEVIVYKPEAPSLFGR